MDKDENRESQESETEATEDLEVKSDEAENVSGGLRPSNPDAGAQRA